VSLAVIVVLWYSVGSKRVLDNGCAACLTRVVYARKEAMLMGRRRIVIFVIILLAVFVLLTYISPNAM
jgi:hypothetical protein